MSRNALKSISLLAIGAILGVSASCMPIAPAFEGAEEKIAPRPATEATKR